jgi:hypothetical protein
MTETITVPFYFVNKYDYSGGWNLHTLIQANTGRHFAFLWDTTTRNEVLHTNLIRHTCYNLIGVGEKLEKYNFTLTLEKTPVKLDKHALYAATYYFKIVDESHEELLKIINMLRDGDTEYYLNKSLKALGLEGDI